MSESKLKGIIKTIGKNASLDNIDKSLHLSKTILRHITNKATKQQAVLLNKDLKEMKSKGHINHDKLQSDIASLYMFV